MRAIYSEVVTLVRIFLVIPATNATSERTFSALRKIKTYLRSTMAQARHNHLMTLQVHKDRTNALGLTEMTNKFAAGNENVDVYLVNFKLFKIREGNVMLYNSSPEKTEYQFIYL